MKITYGAIVSNASGRFGGLVFTNWKGIPVVRTFRKPSNPNTVLQQNVRNVFTNMNRLYTQMPTKLKAAWDTFATGRPYLGRNKLIGRNGEVLPGDANMDDFVWTPGDASTVPPAAATFTPGANIITVGITAPSTPTGWTLDNAVACAFQDFDPDVVQPASALAITEGEDASTPYEVILTGLDTAELYQCGAFLEWTAPDATIRFSAFISGQATPT